jgi:hypothetical protein
MDLDLSLLYPTDFLCLPSDLERLLPFLPLPLLLLLLLLSLLLLLLLLSLL